MKSERAPTTATQVRNALRGDSSAEEWLANRAYEAGLRLATFSLGDRDLGQDVGQEVAIRVIRSLAKLRDAERFDAWTYWICAAEIKRAAKRRGRQSFQSYDDAMAELPEGASFVQDLAERDWLLGALAELSDRQRIAIGLRYVYGLTDKEIAEVIRSRRGTVRSLLSRALVRLREHAEALASETDIDHSRQGQPTPPTQVEVAR